jgi:4-amino-4-deoxy-L-arabinose transferase-like glycosyltransferase
VIPPSNSPGPHSVATGVLYRHRILLSLVFFAFLLRIWGIWNADSTDEYNEVFEALRVCSGHLNYERWFKRFYLYILSGEYGIYYVFGWLFNHFSSPADFAARIVRDLDPLFLLGRITSAFMGTFSVFMTYLIGNKLYGKQVALIAALFLCFNVVNVELSHYARVDATLCAVVLTAFYFIVRILQNNDGRVINFYALSGLFSGIAFQNKIPSVILVIPFMYAHLATSGFRLTVRNVLNRKLVCFCGLFLVGMIIGNPAVLLAPVKFVQGVLATGAVFTTPINETKSEHIGYISYLIYFFRELGLPLSLLALYSVIIAIISRCHEDRLLLSFIIPFYGLMGASQYMVGYSYMIPMMPFLYILCAKGLISALQNIKTGWASTPLFLGATIAVLLVYPVINVGTLLLSFSGENTRYVAKRWIEANIPFGNKVLMDSGKTINSTAPTIAQNRESILATITELEDKIAGGTLKDPTKIVDDNAVKYYKMLLQTVPEESYDITSTKFGLELKSIDYYLESGYKYFIISNSMKRSRSDSYTAERYPKSYQFYSSLDTDSRLRLIKVIAPTATSSGDTFSIYKVLK